MEKELFFIADANTHRRYDLLIHLFVLFSFKTHKYKVRKVFVLNPIINHSIIP